MIPRRLEVGPLVYRIRRGDIEDFGHVLWNEYVIELRRRMAHETTRETLFHELLHVCMDTAGLELEHDEEERVVRRLSPVLLDTLRRNATLQNYLLG